MNKYAFSLIELMVVIAIVAILAAVALPAYKNYTIKAKVSAVVSYVNGTRERMINFYNKRGYWPNTEDLFTPDQMNSGYGYNPAPYVGSVGIDKSAALPCLAPFGLIYLSTRDFDPYIVTYYLVGENRSGTLVSMCEDSIDYEQTFQSNYFKGCTYSTMAEFYAALCS